MRAAGVCAQNRRRSDEAGGGVIIDVSRATQPGGFGVDLARRLPVQVCRCNCTVLLSYRWAKQVLVKLVKTRKSSAVVLSTGYQVPSIRCERAVVKGREKCGRQERRTLFSRTAHLEWDHDYMYKERLLHPRVRGWGRSQHKL